MMPSLPLRRMLDELAARASISCAVRLPDGTSFTVGGERAQFTIVFHTEMALFSTVVRRHIGLMEAYFDQSVDIEGDLGAALAAGMASGFDQNSGAMNGIENDLHELRYSNADPARAKANARAHYGLGTLFYRLWLDDPLMMYTCGYWPEGTRTLEQAQRNKIDHVCRKIRLTAQDRFIDIGCGFGGFMFRAQETRGARGVGINTTTEQVEWLRDEIGRRALGASLEVREADFRDVDAQYDKVVSIGTLEHAGRDQLPEVVRAHAAFLKPGGLGLLHFIGHVGRFDTELFIRKHVFPGGWIPSLADVIIEMERSGLEVIRYDAESLHEQFGSRFRLVESSKELHQTPFGSTQQFLYCYCRLD